MSCRVPTPKVLSRTAHQSPPLRMSFVGVAGCWIKDGTGSVGIARFFVCHLVLTYLQVSVCVCVCVCVCHLNVLLTVDNPSCVPDKLRALIFKESLKGFSPEDSTIIQETLNIEGEDVDDAGEEEEVEEENTENN